MGQKIPSPFSIEEEKKGKKKKNSRENRERTLNVKSKMKINKENMDAERKRNV